LPVLRMTISLILRRRPLLTTLFTLVLLTAGTAIGLLNADARLMMAREMPRTAADEWHRSWETSGAFRRAMRGMTWGFGLAFLIDAAARVVMSYTLPLDLVPVASTALLILLLVAVVQTGKAWGRRRLSQPSDAPP
jgi:hypothetical protein